MTREPEVIAFDPDDADGIVARMIEMRTKGAGWMNIQPVIDPADVPNPRSQLGRVFSARGPDIQLCSWVPGSLDERGGGEPTSIGLQHCAGMKALPRLREFGLDLPAGSRLLTDHPRRGLVVILPDDADVAEVLDWLLRAAVVLTPFELPFEWRAAIYS